MFVKIVIFEFLLITSCDNISVSDNSEGKTPFNSYKKCQGTFQNLRRTLIIHATVIVDTNASTTRSGRLLFQIQDEEEKVLGYFGRQRAHRYLCGQTYRLRSTQEKRNRPLD